jgi:starch phosphorylase
MENVNKFPNLPERISGLEELAYNLWWSWHPEGRALFTMLGGRSAWSMCRHNPVRMINQLDERALKAASEDPYFLRHYDAVMTRLQTDLDPLSGWFCTNIADPKISTLAYFSAEWGLHHALPFYAGGLGFLAGDFLKECSDLGIPAIGVGFMYPEGYLLQKITSDGWQSDSCELIDRENAPIMKMKDSKGNPLRVRIPVIEPPICVEVWKVKVGRADLYLMDTAVETNEPWVRCISDRLYTGDPEQRLRQEIVLGIGGVRVLKALGIVPSILHLNEGHPAFAILERIRDNMASGMSYKEASRAVMATTIFTTHTPVPAGHDRFPFSLMEKYFKTYLFSLGLTIDDFFGLGIDPRDSSGNFNLTAFALRMASHSNCVSRKHQEVTCKMWHHLWPDLPEDQVPIDYVTNGIHVPSWIARRLGDVILNQYLGRDWLEEHDKASIWELVEEIPDEVLWRHHCLMKKMLVGQILGRARKKWVGGADPGTIAALGVLLDERVLTLGFARRFASYKRATLILHDIERLKKIVNDPARPVQIVFAGKAHPDDQYGKQLLQRIFNASRDRAFAGRIAFVEDYDEYLAQYLVHGVDVWVNNPLPPMEACGTSGMKATLNGVPQLSILDGWWIEGYNKKNGWAFGGAEGEDRDDIDAKAIYDILEKKIIPLFYNVHEADLRENMPRDWVRVMKEAIKGTGPHFSARRMVKEYTEKFYKDALNSRKN